MAKNSKKIVPTTTGGFSGAAVATPPRPATTSAPRPATTSAAPTYEQISQRAQEIWMKKGCLPGQDEQNWLEAERQLKAELARK
jgi:hypothetical protein